MINVTILDSVTGEQRSYQDDFVWSQDPDDFSEYIWSDGNYSCDCNRGLFFERAAGIPYSGETVCGQSRYFLFICDEAGTEVYRDGDWPHGR